MASQVRHSGYFFPQKAASKPQPPVSGTAGAARIAALSVEFVAKPEEANRVEATIRAAIDGVLKDVTGFAGSFVLISEQEARLVTVVTLWDGEDRMKHCHENFSRVHALLTPYLDRHLCVQTMVMQFRVLSITHPEKMDISECSTMPDFDAEAETFGVA